MSLCSKARTRARRKWWRDNWRKLMKRKVKTVRKCVLKKKSTSWLTLLAWLKRRASWWWTHFPLEPKRRLWPHCRPNRRQSDYAENSRSRKRNRFAEFGQKAGDIVIGQANPFERGNLYCRPWSRNSHHAYEEQILANASNRERIRALLLAEETPRGIFLKLSRSHPDFLAFPSKHRSYKVAQLR